MSDRAGLKRRSPIREESLRRWSRLRLGDAGVGHLPGGRLLGHAGPVAQGELGYRIAEPLAGVPRTDAQEHARAVAGANEDVLGERRAVHEVPGAQAALLSLDEEKALAAQDQEVLLALLGVVVAVGLARPHHLDVDPVVREVGRALERDARAELFVVNPRALAGVQDEPPLAGRLLAVGAFLHRGLWHHVGSLLTRVWRESRRPIAKPRLFIVG